MSRNLPARPNLEFLKKEAKSLLDVLLQRDGAAQLADAQHALARDYGFASWPKLKAHVESVRGPAASVRGPLDRQRRAVEAAPGEHVPAGDHRVRGGWQHRGHR